MNSVYKTINPILEVSILRIKSFLIATVLELNIITTVIIDSIQILLLSINTSDSRNLGIVRDRNVDIRVLGVLLWRC